MPALGGSRGYPTENQPLSYAQQYGGGVAAAPPTGITGFGYTGATTGTTPSATIGGSPAPSYAGSYGTTVGQNQAGASSLLQGYQASPSAQPGQMPGANIIGGQLPWGAGGGNMFQGLSGDPATTLANLGANYQNAYNSSLAQNQSNYNNILAGYQQTAQNQTAGQQATQAGYGQLSHDVLGGIAGIGSDQRALLARQYQQQRGNAMQGLINSGLGNSTVTSSVNRGIGLDEALAGNNLANSIAQTKAGFQSNLGLAGLGYQGQSVRDSTALSQNQLNWMNSVNAGYPDANQYGQLAQQAGAAIQSNANRDQIDRLAGQNSDLGAQVRQAAVLGGSGGTQPGTGGRLPLSSINYGAGASSPGTGGGGLSFGSDFFTAPGTRAPGTGGGGAMQQASAPRGGSSGGFGSGLASAPGVTNYMGGNAGAAAAGFPSVVGAGLSAADQFNQQFNAQRAALGLPPVAPGQESATVAGAFGAGAAGGANWAMNGTPQDYLDFGAGAAGGAGNYYDPGGTMGLDEYGGGMPQEYNPYANPFGFGAPDQGGYVDAASNFGLGGFAGADMFGYGGLNQSSMSGNTDFNGGDYYYYG